MDFGATSHISESKYGATNNKNEQQKHLNINKDWECDLAIVRRE